MTINNEHKKLNVPNLRFPEFQGEWEKCKLGDYGKVVTGNTPPTKDIENYENGTYLWASPADLGIIKSITETKTMLSAQGFSKTRTLPKGSVLVTCIGSTIGKAGMATKEMSTNQQINSIVVNDKTTMSLYIMQYKAQSLVIYHLLQFKLFLLSLSQPLNYCLTIDLIYKNKRKLVIFFHSLTSASQPKTKSLTSCSP